MTARHNRRIFRQHRRRRATLLVALAVIVAGCAQTVADWTPPEQAHELQVRWITHEHSIAFNRQEVLLSKTEARRLDRFLAQIDLRPTDRVFLDIGPRSGEVVDDARVDVINDRLRHFVPNAEAAPIVGDKGSADNVQLIIGRYVAVLPECPDFSSPGASNPNNYPDSNFGCATQRNLGLMLADPGELLQGRTLGPADGEAHSKIMRENRAGEVQFPHAPDKHIRR